MKQGNTFPTALYYNKALNYSAIALEQNDKASLSLTLTTLPFCFCFIGKVFQLLLVSAMTFFCCHFNPSKFPSHSYSSLLTCQIDSEIRKLNLLEFKNLFRKKDKSLNSPVVFCLTLSFLSDVYNIQIQIN